MGIACPRLFQAPKLQKNNETPPLFIASLQKYPRPTCRRRQTATSRAASWSSLTLCQTAAAPRCSPTPGRQTVGSIALQPYPGAAIRYKAISPSAIYRRADRELHVFFVNKCPLKRPRIYSPSVSVASFTRLNWAEISFWSIT